MERQPTPDGACIIPLRACLNTAGRVWRKSGCKIMRREGRRRRQRERLQRPALDSPQLLPVDCLERSPHRRVCSVSNLPLRMRLDNPLPRQERDCSVPPSRPQMRLVRRSSSSNNNKDRPMRLGNPRRRVSLDSPRRTRVQVYSVRLNPPSLPVVSLARRQLSHLPDSSVRPTRRRRNPPADSLASKTPHRPVSADSVRINSRPRSPRSGLARQLRRRRLPRRLVNLLKPPRRPLALASSNSRTKLSHLPDSALVPHRTTRRGRLVPGYLVPPRSRSSRRVGCLAPRRRTMRPSLVVCLAVRERSPRLEVACLVAPVVSRSYDVDTVY